MDLLKQPDRKRLQQDGDKQAHREIRQALRKIRHEPSDVHGKQSVMSEGRNSPLAPKDLPIFIAIPKSFELLFRVVLGPS